ncbi:NnrS family protein [Shimia sp.]|uniref:NnrS family protein n=1 Tax=Shimia sp. TaxID=1954381 RepID=UPI00356214BC
MTVIKRVLGEGFRVFFLCAGLYAVFAGAIWAMWLLAQARGAELALPVADPQMWHAHEMIFGYAGAAMGGFFLTAVPNWTNTPGARIGFLSVAAGLWLAGRLAMWGSGVLPAPLVAVADLGFVPILSLKIASQLIKRPKPQNMMFLLILTLLWLGNLFVHLEWLGVMADSAGAGLRAGLFALCAMIVVLGGRITPAFTRNAMKREGVPEAGWPVSVAPLEKAALVLALALPISVLMGAAGLPEAVAAVVAILLGAVQFMRLLRWRGGWTLRQPILFALHLGLAMLGAGLILWGLAALGLGQEVAALHLLAIGGVGGMTLAVMSRAALGHSGRALIAPKPVALGYGLLALTALLRWGAGQWAGEGYFLVMAAISLLWTVVFVLFSMCLWPALVKPRLS